MDGVKVGKAKKGSTLRTHLKVLDNLEDSANNGRYEKLINAQFGIAAHIYLYTTAIDAAMKITAGN